MTTSDRAATSLSDLEKQTHAFDTACVQLEDMVAALEVDLEAVKRRHLPALKRQAAVVASREAELQGMVEGAPQLFQKPRTLVLNGIKVGFVASVGSITWDDDAQVVALIRRHRKEEAETLVRVSEAPNKAALKSLPAADLAKLRCRIEGAGDKVVLSRVAGDVEKLVNKLIEKMVAAMTDSEKAG